MRNQRLFVFVTLCLVISACRTSTIQYRATGKAIPPIQVVDLEKRNPVDDGKGGKACSELLFRGRSIEKFKAPNGEIFTVGVIELSDDGHLKDVRQRDEVFRELKRVAREGDAEVKETKGAVVVTFVHGWHHRAKVCDENLSCFRRAMEGLVMRKGERANQGPVFGLYVGWRGESLRGQAGTLTFYERKNTAQHVGALGGRELLLELNQIQRDLDREVRESTGGKSFVNMVTVGHSFGGALVYSAMESLKVSEYAANAVSNDADRHGVGYPACDGKSVKPVRAGIGDLVILVNPAFEAWRYRYFAEDLTKAGAYSPDQRPVLMTVASEADQAVGVAFPAGRFFWLLWHPASWSRASAEITGLGHYAPYTTHKLTFAGVEEKPNQLVELKDSKAIEDCGLQDEVKHDLVRKDCDCSYAVLSAPPTASDVGKSDNAVQLKEGNGSVHAINNDVKLQPIDPGHWDTHAPFLVASAPGNLISGHNDIYNPNFVMFLIGYINSTLQGPGPAKPAVEAIPQCF
jgi:hypothetical protein